MCVIFHVCVNTYYRSAYVCSRVIDSSAQTIPASSHTDAAAYLGDSTVYLSSQFTIYREPVHLRGSALTIIILSRQNIVYKLSEKCRTLRYVHNIILLFHTEDACTCIPIFLRIHACLSNAFVAFLIPGAPSQ